MQSDNHAQSLLPSQVQQELQRVLWSAIKSHKRTLFGQKINDLNDVRALQILNEQFCDI